MYEWILFVHILAATIWTGGHLILSIVILPKVLRANDPAILLDFEQSYERIGLPALVTQVISGLWLAGQNLPEFSQWVDFDDPAANLIQIKLLLLLLTVGFAIDAKIRLLSDLTIEKLVPMAFHIIPVTILSVLFVVVGVAFRSGGF